jgi:beta-galactosidase
MRQWILFILSLVITSSALADSSSIDLAGQWRFAMDPKDTGVTAAWFNTTLADKINLPGILQSQGFGDDISIDTPWVAALPRDFRWYLLPQYKAYTTPGNVKVPYLSQPPKHYLGPAWYQRDIDIPDSWKSKRIQLILERAHWETTVWIDDKQIGKNNSLVAPHDYELGQLTPGPHHLTIRIDNRMILPYRPDGHSVSDHLGGTWNGIVGTIALSATSPVWIDDAQVFPDIEKKSATIKVKIGNITNQPGTGKLSAGSASSDVKWDTTGGTAELTVPLGDSAQLWDEYHPNLQHLTLKLTGNPANDQRPLTFGLRQIKTDDTTMLLNGRPIYIRATHWGGDFALTGYPATDVPTWKKILQTCKDYGLNAVRFHSWCPPEAAFTAADELGFYLQPECGMWNNFSNPTIPPMLEAETARMMKAYGNHPSYLLLSPTNEPAGAWTRYLPQWTVEWYQKDPRRLYSENTGRVILHDTGPTFGIFPARGVRGWFDSDYSSFLQNVHIPVLGHEVGQWCAYPDFDVIKKFTGYLRPGNYEIFRDSAVAHGVIDRDKEFSYASGKFQVACYKQEIEANLRTPGMAGYQLLDLHDYLGQGTALIGILDAFWESKGYVTPEEFRRFTGPTVPLARMHNYIYLTSDKLQVPIEIAHYGESPLTAAHPEWSIVDLAGNTAAHGTLPTLDIPIGKNLKLGDVEVDLSTLKAPSEYRLVVSLAGTSIQNSWNFWLYPATLDTTPPSDVLLTSDWSEAKTKLSQGGKVLFNPPQSSLDDTSPPLDNVPVFWNRLMNPKLSAMLGLWCDANHPALAAFPTEGFCDLQWAEIVRNVRAINIEKSPPELRPIVSAIDDWNRNYKLAVLFECRIGEGRLLVCAPDIQSKLDSRTIARQLRRSLLDYMATDNFQPTVTLTVDQANSLWPGRNGVQAPTTKPQANPGDINEGPNLTPRSRQ